MARPKLPEVREVLREVFVLDPTLVERMKPLGEQARARRVDAVAAAHNQLMEVIRPDSPVNYGRRAILARHRPDDVILGFERVPRCRACSFGGAVLLWPCPDYRDAVTDEVADLVIHLTLHKPEGAS